MKRGLIILLFGLTGITSLSQNVSGPYIIEMKAHSGMILPIYEALDYLVEDDIYALDLSVSIPAYGRDYWEKLYHYPRTGAGLSFWNLGNNKVLGKAYSLYSFINIPIFRRPGRFSFNYQISLGGAYITRSFDKADNHLNRAMGSPVNIYVRLSIDGKIHFSPQTELVIEAGTTHFSNGKTRSPNYGINAGSFALGINYRINNDYLAVYEPEVPEINKTIIQSFIWLAGVKVYDNLLNKKYLTSSFSYNIEHFIDHRRKLGLGADLFYDGSINEALSVEKGTEDNGLTKLIRLGIHASYSAQYKHFSAGIQAGYYLYSKYIVLTSIYNKIYLQYLFTPNILGSIAVKSHWGKADCFEYGLGVYW